MGATDVSGKTFAELITSARYDVNDTKSPYFADDDEMLDWADRGHAQAAKDSASIQDVESIDLIASTLEYQFTTAYHRIHAVQYLDASSNRKALMKGTPAEVGHVYDVSEPVKYYEFEDKLGIYPVLASKTTETVRVYLSKQATIGVALTDAVETPAILDNALIAYIVAMWERKRKHYSAYAQAMAFFDAEVYKARTEFYPGFNE